MQFSQGTCGYPSESTLAVVSLHIPPYALYPLCIVGTVGRWWYKVRYPPFPCEV